MRWTVAILSLLLASCLGTTGQASRDLEHQHRALIDADLERLIGCREVEVRRRVDALSANAYFELRGCGREELVFCGKICGGDEEGCVVLPGPCCATF